MSFRLVQAIVAASVRRVTVLLPWLRELLAVMGARPATRFMSVGVPGCASPFAERV